MESATAPPGRWARHAAVDKYEAGCEVGSSPNQGPFEVLPILPVGVVFAVVLSIVIDVLL